MISKLLAIALALCIATSVRADDAPRSDDVEAFTEPYRDIEAAAAETGVLARISVKEGDRVSKGDELASLDQSVLKATLAVARKSAEARGVLDAAQAELKLKEDRLEKLTALRLRNLANAEEVASAEAERDVARARVVAEKDNLAIKQLEYERIQAQVRRRAIHAPIDGVVVEILKDAGEFVSPTDAAVMRVVQLDPLLVVFAVPTGRAQGLEEGATVQLQMDGRRRPVQATVEHVSPITIARTGAVRVKVRIPNADGRHRSGVRCTLMGESK